MPIAKVYSSPTFNLKWYQYIVLQFMWCNIELIKTAGGEYVSPVYIENCIKSEVPFLSNVMVVGDNREYLICLITLKVH